MRFRAAWWDVFGRSLVTVSVLVAGCGATAERPGDGEPAAPTTVQVGQENVVTVARDTIVTGPPISGELRAAREATVRAELGGSVLEVRVEEGQSVRQGALLGRIEAATLDDTVRSAESAVRSADNQLAVQRREAERTEELVSAGALAARDLDLARNNVTAAEAQVADARARLLGARKQLGDAVIRSPIAGVVSDRAVNAGDVVAPGTPLFTIIDPSSMRLEAAVTSEELGALRVGADVRFTVRGYEQAYQGRIERISPAADPTTRQVPIFVSIPNSGGRLVSGLYAAGRVVSQSATGLVVASNAVRETGGSAGWVLRVAGGKTQRVDVALGLRDLRTERVQITRGVNEGDVLLRGSAQAIPPGTPVAVGTLQPAK